MILFIVEDAQGVVHFVRYDDPPIGFTDGMKKAWRRTGGRVLAVVRPKRTTTTRHLEYRMAPCQALKHWNVTLDTFDGQQYGIMTLCVEAYTVQQAEQKAMKQATDDGWQRVKVMFTRS